MQTFADLDILRKFFWNYSQEDIEELSRDHRFNHFWQFKRFEYPPITDNYAQIVDTYFQLWMGYIDYFPDDMRMIILKHAKKRFEK